jgi:calmodulin
MQAALVDPGAVAAQEPGMEAMEDEYGFLIDEGGYFKFKGTSMMTGIGNPMTLVQELVDPSIIERLEGYLGGMVEFLQAVEEKATEMREYWLEVDGGAQLVERSRAAHAEEVARLEAEAVALAESAVDEDEIKLRAIWEIVDADGSGMLCVDETRQVFAAMGKNSHVDKRGHMVENKHFHQEEWWNNPKRMKKVFNQLDRDKSGEVDFDELLYWWKQQKGKAQEAFGKGMMNMMTASAKAAAAAAEIFSLFDADGSGEIDTSELAKMSIELGNPMSEDELSTAIEEMDENGNGTIDQNEFVKWWSTVGPGAVEETDEDDEEEAKLRLIWTMVDKDSNGHLDHAEVMELFLAMGKKMSESKLADAFKELDTNKSGNVDFDELLVWWKQQKAKDKAAFDESRFEESLQTEERRLRELWAVVDVDGSGQLDEDEAWSVFTNMGMDLNERAFRKQYKSIDEDENGYLDFAEMWKWWKKQKHSARDGMENVFRAGKGEKEVGDGLEDEMTEEEKARRAEEDELNKIQVKLDKAAKRVEKSQETAVGMVGNLGKAGLKMAGPKGMFSLVDKAAALSLAAAKGGLGVVGEGASLTSKANPFQRDSGSVLNENAPKYQRTTEFDNDEVAFLEEERVAAEMAAQMAAVEAEARAKIEAAAKAKIVVKEHKIQMPTPHFLKGGIETAIDMLRPMLEQMGGRVAKASGMIKFSTAMRSTACRRAVDHLIQELLVDKARKEIFPELEKVCMVINRPIARVVTNALVVYRASWRWVCRRSPRRLLSAWRRTLPRRRCARASTTTSWRSSRQSRRT